ncbi:hypothetical protein Tco_0710588, partial [Tanacetum coccineum]
YFSFGRHLDELHVTLAHLEKKWTRLQTNTKTLEDLCSKSLETASPAIHDAVTTHQVMSTPAYVDSESITQADGAQSSRVPVPLPDDPYVAVRQARLVDTESEPEEAPSEAEELQSLGSRVPLMGEEFEAVEPLGTRTDSSHSSASSDSTTPMSPDHPLTHISPAPTPTRALFHRRMARMTVHVQPAISSYESSLSSSSSLALLVQKRYRGMPELILDTDSKGDELGDEDIEEDEEDESLDADDEGKKSAQMMRVIEEEEAALEGQQRAVLVLDIAASKPLGLRYKAARSSREQIGSRWVDPKDDRVHTDIPVYPLVAPVQTPLSPEWSYGSLPISPSSPVVPLPISVGEDQFIEVGVQLELHRSILKDHTQCLDGLPPTLVTDIDRDVREMYTRSGVRPVLALEAWAGHGELQEIRGRVAALEQEKGRREP